MYDALLIVHFLGLALGVGTSFAMFTLGIATRDLEGEERMKFYRRATLLRKNGSIGLALLILSGLGFLALRGASSVFAWGGGAFHAKLLLVVILIGLVGYSQVLFKRVRQGNTQLMARMPMLGNVMLAVSVGIVISAVLAFH